MRMTEEEMRQEQIKQATKIAKVLKERFPALEVSGQEYAESKRYVAVYVTLVPNTVRLVILLSDAGLNANGFHLRGMADLVAEADEFRAFMRRTHPEIKIRNEKSCRPYARVPVWQGLRIANDDHEEIARNVLVGLAFIANLPTPRWDA